MRNEKQSIYIQYETTKWKIKIKWKLCYRLETWISSTDNIVKNKLQKYQLIENIATEKAMNNALSRETNLVAANTKTPVKTSTPSNSVRNCIKWKNITMRKSIHKISWGGVNKRKTDLINNTISDSSVVMPPFWCNGIKFIKKEKARWCSSCF